MGNNKHSPNILIYSLSLVVTLIISFSLFACDNLQSIPFSQVVADAKAGKIIKIIYQSSNDLKVCYNIDCSDAKDSTKPVGNESLLLTLTNDGVTMDKMPDIEVPAGVIPTLPPPTPIAKTIPFSQVVADAKVGKIALIKYSTDSDTLTVCYDAVCANAKASIKPTGNETLFTMLRNAGVPNNKIPNIQVSPPSP